MSNKTTVLRDVIQSTLVEKTDVSEEHIATMTLFPFLHLTYITSHFPNLAYFNPKDEDRLFLRNTVCIYRTTQYSMPGKHNRKMDYFVHGDICC